MTRVGALLNTYYLVNGKIMDNYARKSLILHVGGFNIFKDKLY